MAAPPAPAPAAGACRPAAPACALSAGGGAAAPSLLARAGAGPVTALRGPSGSGPHPTGAEDRNGLAAHLAARADAAATRLRAIGRRHLEHSAILARARLGRLGWPATAPPLPLPA
ncbi:MAG TPA: hypothetical protein VFQ38_01370 [Longimicrobiales bacterium]|nr:hypothetical protein [Longimicrobiales bacterium]